MTLELVEGDLVFEFDSERWKSLLRWDRHAAYRTGIGEMDGSKAVDFIGLYGAEDIFFIEVKDYRIYARTKPGDSWDELELKVRNTIAGLVGSVRRGYADVCGPFLKGLQNQYRVTLVYWMELPPPANAALRRRRVAATGFATRQARRYVKWLDARAFNVSQENDYERLVPGLTVKSLPRKRRELAEAVEQVLQNRGIAMDQAARDQISDERDPEVLARWLERASTVLAVRELFGGRR